MFSNFFEDIALVIFLTLLCISTVLISPLNETALRVVLGIMLLLFLPRYSLVAALYPKRADFDGIERIALIFGLSIVVAPLIGMVLNYTPFGIGLSPMIIALSIFTIALAIIAYFRRLSIPKEDRIDVKFGDISKDLFESLHTSGPMIDKALTVILVISIVVSIGMTIYIIVTPKQGEKFTEFYILGKNGTADEYPTDLMVEDVGGVIIGIVNHEYANITYRLEIRVNGTIISEDQVYLMHNETWEEPFQFRAIQEGEDWSLEFLLYREGVDEVYRSLHLWVDINEEQKE
ncbi:MAG: DUF1616 domain-containing protein [Halobacteriota archaeon]|nr:DUF1616 domain-containing protein [Halobacteriota archaeon]